MASIGGCSTFIPCFKPNQACNHNAVLTFAISRRSFPSLKLRSARVSCAATPETVNKVCKVIKNQLGVPEDYDVTGESKFSVLGADSLFAVELVLGLEAEFGIHIEEVSSHSIVTVQDAADLIENLIANK